MNPIVQHIIANWKTTLSSVLSAWLAISSALTGADFAGVSGFHASKWFLIAGVIAKVLLGSIQSDAKPAVTSSVTIETTSPLPVVPTKPEIPA